MDFSKLKNVICCADTKLKRDEKGTMEVKQTNKNYKYILCSVHRLILLFIVHVCLCNLCNVVAAEK